jgi:alkylhydroperoxidase family enzyme
MAYVALDTKAKGMVARMGRRYTKRRFGREIDPITATSHHAGVLVATGALELAVEKGWKKLDPTLRWLAVQRAGMLVGCSWCIDFGYFEGMHKGIDSHKVRAVGEWRASALFDERERMVLEYAELATRTPSSVGADMAARLHGHFSDEEIVELAGWVALENFRSRLNAGLGLHSQGFADNCEVPMTHQVEDATTRA